MIKLMLRWNLQRPALLRFPKQVPLTPEDCFTRPTAANIGSPIDLVHRFRVRPQGAARRREAKA